MTVHVAFRYGDTLLFSRLVCLVRGGDSAHCEAAIPQGGKWLCISSSWLDGGVRAKVMDLPREKWRIYATDVPDEAALDWFTQYEGQGYGWIKLMRHLWPWFRPSFGGPNCTEAVAEIVGLGHSDTWDLRGLEAAVAWRWPRFWN